MIHTEEVVRCEYRAKATAEGMKYFKKYYTIPENGDEGRYLSEIEIPEVAYNILKKTYLGDLRVFTADDELKEG